MIPTTGWCGQPMHEAASRGFHFSALQEISGEMKKIRQ
jgi:hypothetical protein